MVLATYLAEDGLVGHQWEERPLVLRVFDSPVEELEKGLKELKGFGSPIGGRTI